MNAVDTNVLIYACDSADVQRQAQAVDLPAGLRDAVMLWQVACEFIAAARKLAPCGFTAGEVRAHGRAATATLHRDYHSKAMRGRGTADA